MAQYHQNYPLAKRLTKMNIFSSIGAQGDMISDEEVERELDERLNDKEIPFNVFTNKPTKDTLK